MARLRPCSRRSHSIGRQQRTPPKDSSQQVTPSGLNALFGFPRCLPRGETRFDDEDDPVGYGGLGGCDTISWRSPGHHPHIPQPRPEIVHAARPKTPPPTETTLL